MQVEFNPDMLRTHLELWKNMLDMRVPVRDEFKIHFMEQRHVILENYRSAAISWSTMLSSMAPMPGHEEDFVLLWSEVKCFKKWAEDELTKLKELAHD